MLSSIPPLQYSTVHFEGVATFSKNFWTIPSWAAVTLNLRKTSITRNSCIVRQELGRVVFFYYFTNEGAIAEMMNMCGRLFNVSVHAQKFHCSV